LAGQLSPRASVIALSSLLISIGCVAAQRAPEKPQAPTPKKLEPFTETIPNSLVTFDMVPIPGKEAKAGSDEPSIKPLFISRHEVTWDAYDIFVFRLDLAERERAAEGRDAQSRPSKPYGAPDRGFGHAGYPALAMTYHAAQKYCEWLSQKTGKKYRLPTEAEWQHACTAGAAGAEQAPASADALGKVAWHWDNAEDKTHPVGKKEPNALGLHDMLGNVAEWAAGRDGNPVACGGSYDDEAKDVTPASRKLPEKAWNATDPQNPKSKWWLSDAPFIGFRVVCEP
jgi:formylglycine-generating enzyme required for sulfatase activity